jgi:hypothetical protein
MIECKINNFITLRFKDNKTVIYVKEKEFKQCKYLLIINPETKEKIINHNSIDEISEKLSSKLEKQLKPEDLEISPEQEFIAHCSNLQTWAELKYDTRILHSNLAFPLLKRLTEIGDQTAKVRFREEIAKRLESGYLPVIRYLINERYIEHLDKKEWLFALLEPDDAEVMLSINKFLKKDKIRPLASFEDVETVLNYFVVENKRVIGLHLEYLSTHIFPIELFEEVTRLTSLQILEISHINVENIPDSLYNLQELKVLRLKEIFVGGNLPEAITKIASLEIVDLSRNFISSIPTSIENLTHLKELYLEMNKIRIISDSITNLQSLEILNLEGNEIKELPQSIGNMRKIKEINLARNRLEKLPKSTAKLSSIEILKLHGNRLVDLPDIFYKLESLHTIFLNNNKGLEEYVVKVFCMKKNFMKSLRNLYLDKEQIKLISSDCNLLKRKKIVKIYK